MATHSSMKTWSETCDDIRHGEPCHCNVPVRVFIADDHDQVRWALHLLFKLEPGVDIVGEAKRSEELLALVATSQPDVLLLDWELPGSSGPLLLKLVRSIDRDIPLEIVVLSGKFEAQQAALQAGADAFVSKSENPEHLLMVFNQVRRALYVRKIADGDKHPL